MAKYSTLRDGSWGVRGTAQELQAGHPVTVTKRDGTTKVERVKRVLWTDGQNALASLDRTNQAPVVPFGRPDRAQFVQTDNGVKGQTYRVARGRKVPVGTVGVAVWFGTDSYGKARVGLKDAQGQVHWTAFSNVEPVTPAPDAAARFEAVRAQVMTELLENGNQAVADQVATLVNPHAAAPQAPPAPAPAAPRMSLHELAKALDAKAA